MFKKTLLATVTTAALLGPVAAFAAGEMGQGTITFTGSVTEAPCSVSAADTNLAIDLGQVSKNMLTGTGKFGTAVPIEIHLTGCSFAAATGNTAAPLSKVSVSFPGLTSTTGMVPNTGNATNVAIQMLNRDNTNLNFTTGSSETEMRNGDGSLQLFARIASNSATAAGAGSVTAKVTYMLNYK